MRWLCRGGDSDDFSNCGRFKIRWSEKSIFFRRDNENKLKLDFKKRITSKASTSRIKTSNAKHAKQKLTRLNRIR